MDNGILGYIKRQRGDGRKNNAKNRRRLVFAVVVAVVISAAIGTGIIWWSRKPEETTEKTTESVKTPEINQELWDRYRQDASDYAANAETATTDDDKKNWYMSELHAYQAAGDRSGAESVVKKFLDKYPDEDATIDLACTFYSGGLGYDEEKMETYCSQITIDPDDIDSDDEIIDDSSDTEEVE